MCRPRCRLLVLVLGVAVCGCGSKQKSTAELLSDLKGNDPLDRLVAVRLLPERKQDAAEVVPALTEAVRDKSVDIRLSAVIGLGTFGQEAKAAVPALETALKDPDRRVRDAAVVAIRRIDPRAAEPGSAGRR